MNQEPLSVIWERLAKTGLRDRESVPRKLAEQHDENGMTLLHHAAMHGRNDLLPGLLDAGCAINARTLLGETPLDLALTYGFSKMATLMRAAKAQESAVLDAIENWSLGKRDVLTAARAGHFETIIADIKAGKRGALQADELTQRDPAGENALSILSRQRTITSALDPKLWAGRAAERNKLVEILPLDALSAEEKKTLLSQTRLIQLDAMSRKRPKRS